MNIICCKDNFGTIKE